MDAQRWSQLSALFEEALDLPPEQRETFIAGKCADPELARALRGLLAADADAEVDEFLESPLTPLPAVDWQNDPAQAMPAYAPGTRQFGPYRLLRPIGQGGMGEVHLAERSDGAFEQRVALKLLPHPTPGLIQRFRQERQILARLEHPNIARLLDGGVGEENVPYFAMEYVDGEPITTYVIAQKFSINATLLLFLRVCAAVQYAHRNLVVHRDIKPSNVLVSIDGTPKLLDFGIAKILDATEPEHHTRTATRMFTPDYAAPEQICGDPITTATDVYALGVMLYELLTGARPYKLARGKSLEQAILDTQPVAPSVALQKLTGSIQRSRILRGDLDRIVLTALAKEPGRRYSSAETLAADIRNFLERRPIAARGDSSLYRMRQFVRRNRVAVFAASLAVLALLIGSGLALWQAHHAQIQAQRAEAKSQTAQAVKDYMMSVFISADPYHNEGNVVGTRELLENGERDVARKLAKQPEVQADMYRTFAMIFAALDRNDLAHQSFESAATAYRSYLPETSVEILEMRMGAITADFGAGKLKNIVDPLRALTREIPNDADYDKVRGQTQQILFVVAASTANYADADATGTTLLDEIRKKYGADSGEIASMLNSLARLRMLEGRLGEAVALTTEFFPMVVRAQGAHPSRLLNDIGLLASLQHDLGHLALAQQLLAATAAARLRMLGEEHYASVAAQASLALVNADLGDTATAKGTLSRALDIMRKRYDSQTDDIAALHYQLAGIMLDRGEADEASAELMPALDIYRAIGSDDNANALACQAGLAHVRLLQNDVAGAITALQPILSLQRQRHDRELPDALLTFAQAQAQSGDRGAAIQTYIEALSVLSTQGRPNCVYAYRTELALTALYQEAKDPGSAKKHARSAAIIANADFGSAHVLARQALDRLLSIEDVATHDSAEQQTADVRNAAARLPDPLDALTQPAMSILAAAEKTSPPESH